MVLLRVLGFGVVTLLGGGAVRAAPSAALRDARFRSPMPGGTCAGYAGDTGLDIAGKFLPVYALAAGTIEYSERGHTVWTQPPDTPFSVRFALDEPIAIEVRDPDDPRAKRRRLITHVYYTHMSRLRFELPECVAPPCAPRIHVDAGELVGTSGIGNGSPHLHVGLLLDGDVSQSTWDSLLREDRIRAVLGGYRNGERLP